jgi:hypothetical protein
MMKMMLIYHYTYKVSLKINRTIAYLFLSQYYLFFDSDARKGIKEAFDLSNKKGVKRKDLLAVFLCDKNIPDAKVEDGIYYILMHTSPSFSKIIEHLKKSDLFIDMYHVGDAGSELAVVRLKVIKGDSFDMFIQSKFSKMYPQQLLKDNARLFQIGEDLHTRQYLMCYNVFVKSEALLEEIAEKYNLDDATVDKLRDEGELSSLLNWDEETFNSSELSTYKNLMHDYATN